MVISRVGSRTYNIEKFKRTMCKAKLNIDTLLPSQDPVYEQLKTILKAAVEKDKGLREAIARL
jgi:hypothetical protein